MPPPPPPPAAGFPVLPAVRSALADALALVLPVSCAGCGAPDRAVCAACERSLQTPVQSRRLLPSSLDVDSVTPSRSLSRSSLKVYSATPYAGAVAHLLPALKDSGRTEAARPLGAALRRALEAGASAYAQSEVGVPPARAGPALVVPVPSASAATRRRGYLPVALLLRKAGVPASRALRFSRRVRDQSELSAAERAANMGASMTADAGVAGRQVILVDDVVTTGATLAEAARAVTARGGLVLFAATVASTPPPDAPVGADAPSPGF